MEVSKMFELIKKTLFAGIGAALLTEEKIENLVEEWIKKGEIGEEEGKKLISDLVNKMKKSKQDLEKKVQEEIPNILTKLNIPTRKEFSQLEKKVDQLTKKIKSN